jgi:hemerythrin-like domain-containing protein
MELEKHGMPREGGPVGVMLSEHDEGRNYIKQAIDAVTEYKQGNADALIDIESNLLNFCTLLTNHIYKEDNILYPMAERMLPVSILETMSLDFEEANLATTNNEYHDKYLKMLDELSSIYLK